MRREDKASSDFYFLGNTSARNYCNRIVYVKIIASLRWVVFETQCSSCEYICKNKSIHNGVYYSQLVSRSFYLAYVTTCQHRCSNFSLAGEGKGPMSYAAV